MHGDWIAGNGCAAVAVTQPPCRQRWQHVRWRWRAGTGAVQAEDSTAMHADRSAAGDVWTEALHLQGCDATHGLDLHLCRSSGSPTAGGTPETALPPGRHPPANSGGSSPSDSSPSPSTPPSCSAAAGSRMDSCTVPSGRVSSRTVAATSAATSAASSCMDGAAEMYTDGASAPPAAAAAAAARGLSGSWEALEAMRPLPPMPGGKPPLPHSNSLRASGRGLAAAAASGVAPSAASAGVASCCCCACCSAACCACISSSMANTTSALSSTACSEGKEMPRVAGTCYSVPPSRAAVGRAPHWLEQHGLQAAFRSLEATAPACLDGGEALRHRLLCSAAQLEDCRRKHEGRNRQNMQGTGKTWRANGRKCKRPRHSFPRWERAWLEWHLPVVPQESWKPAAGDAHPTLLHGGSQQSLSSPASSSALTSASSRRCSWRLASDTRPSGQPPASACSMRACK